MKFTDDMRAAAASLPLRSLSGVFYRQTAPERQPLELPATAVRSGRYHAVGDPWPAYSASTDMAAMAEMLRFVIPDPHEEPPLAIRRVSELVVEEFTVVDYANPLAHEMLGIRASDLTTGFDGDPGTELCRHLADVARERPSVLGLLAPSAARPGAEVLVIFPDGFGQVAVGDQRLLRLALLPEAEPERESATE